jgi:sulfur-carrier protein adenylyltransferase/sulfurtransferase
VLVIGAGGLGSPAALYLAAAGVGTLGIADFDRVAEHNLQRQLLHDDTRIGETKTASAAQRLRATNPHVKIVQHTDGITAENAVKIFSEYDVILDGTDNFSSRYLNNDAAFFAKKPLVYGTVAFSSSRDRLRSLRPAKTARVTAVSFRILRPPAACPDAERPACSARSAE